MGKLPVHTREVLTTPDAPSSRRAYVACPTEARWVPVDACRRCGKGTVSEEPAAEESGVECSALVPARRRGSARRLARDTKVAALMDPNVLCVSPDMSVEAIAKTLRDIDAEAAVVVDGGGCPVGMVTRADLVGAPAEARRVSDVMTPFVTTLLEEARVADALSLIVDRGLHHVPVLSAGRVVGIVSPARALAWLVRILEPCPG
jgi:CBS-domain-containing membrane protein